MSTVDVRIENAIATVTLNRPEALNALNTAMMDELGAAASRLEHDSAVRAVVLTGAGKHFMAGGDVKFFAETVAASPSPTDRRVLFEKFVQRLHPVMSSLRRMPKPVLASVRGAAAGFGLSLMMAADLAIVAEDSYFTLAYANIGTSPDGSSTYVLPRLVGVKRAMEIALLGDRFDAKQALAIGLVNRVVPLAELDAATKALAERLAAGPTAVLGRTKDLINRSLENDYDTQLQLEAESFAASAAGEDFQRGVTAFVEKKKPEFVGR